MGSGGGGDWERVLQRAVAAVRRGDGEGPGIFFGIFVGFSVFGSGTVLFVMVFGVYIIVTCR